MLDYIRFLVNKNDKNSRINANKINDYIGMLRYNGKYIGEPYIKHLDGSIWELRPIRTRILFCDWGSDSYILLHYFIKKTQKTPAREINKAKINLNDLIERNVNYE